MHILFYFNHDKYRGHLYNPMERIGGERMVLHGSKELLKDYQFCVLYTDMLNPTSNKIYQEIGYKHIADSIHISFVE